MKQYPVRRMDQNQTVIMTSDLDELYATASRHETVVKRIRRLIQSYGAVGSTSIPLAAILEALEGEQA